MSVQFPYSQKDSHQIPKSGGEMKHSDNVLTVEAACSERGRRGAWTGESSRRPAQSELLRLTAVLEDLIWERKFSLVLLVLVRKVACLLAPLLNCGCVPALGARRQMIVAAEVNQASDFPIAR